MALIDKIEMLGSAVDNGLMDREDAAVLLAELSEGGPTLVGARNAIANHRGMRERLEHQMRRTVRAVEVLPAVVEAETPEEQAAARIAQTAWQDQERAEMRAQLRADMAKRWT